MYLREVCIHPSQESRSPSFAKREVYERFTSEACFVCDLYRQHLLKVKTEETAKVILDISETKDWVQPKNVRRMLSVTFSPWRVALDDYTNLSEDARARLALETLHSGLKWLAEIEDWKIEPFDLAYQACLSKNLRNEVISKKPEPNPSKTVKVHLHCDFGMHEARYTAIVSKGRKELGRLYLGATIGESYIVWMTMKSLSWVDENRIQIQLNYSGRGAFNEFDLTPIIQQG